jgi:integrase
MKTVLVVNEIDLNNNVDALRHKVVFHTCRHTFGSWHAQKGTPPNVIKELMGYSTIQVTERYSHISADHLRQAMTGFENNKTGSHGYLRTNDLNDHGGLNQDFIDGIVK